MTEETLIKLEQEREQALAVAEALALKLAHEWQEALATLAESILVDAESVVDLTLTPELTCHPFYAGKLSLIQTLKQWADDDEERFQTPVAQHWIDLYAAAARFRDGVVDAETALITAVEQIEKGSKS